MALEVNIIFNGNCYEAVNYYAEIFKTEKPQFIKYSDGDTSFDENVSISQEGSNLIMHSSLMIEGTIINFNDMPDNFGFIRGNAFGITIVLDDKVKAERIYNDLVVDGIAFVPFSYIPEQGYYGMLTDKFDIMWTIRA